MRFIYMYAGVGLLCISLAAPAEEYASLGLTRAQIIEMLTQEGLTPTLNKFPDHIEANIWNPNITIGMYGPDSGLTAIEISVQQHNMTSYWQNYVILWVLKSIFPNWANQTEWFIRAYKNAIMSGAKSTFERNGYVIETASSDRTPVRGYFFIAIMVKETEQVSKPKDANH